jgi:hypothetical protein
MLTYSEHIRREPMPVCTREEAARLLEAIRLEYQALAGEDRNLVKGLMSRLAAGRLCRELREEPTCFA